VLTLRHSPLFEEKLDSLLVGISKAKTQNQYGSYYHPNSVIEAQAK